MDKPTRRFIAGAVCPRCRAVDRIVVEETAGEKRRHCVSCGHTDTLVREAAAEPSTRLSRRRGAGSSEPVRILDPRKDPDGSADR